MKSKDSLLVGDASLLTLHRYQTHSERSTTTAAMSLLNISSKFGNLSFVFSLKARIPIYSLRTQSWRHSFSNNHGGAILEYFYIRKCNSICSTRLQLFTEWLSGPRGNNQLEFQFSLNNHSKAQMSLALSQLCNAIVTSASWLPN